MLPRIMLFVLAATALVLTPTSTDRVLAQSELPFEVVFPKDSSVTHFQNTWGHPRSGGRRHRGTDLMAPKMTEVYALADGVVLHVKESKLAGRYLAIDHGDDWVSYYMHLNNDTPGTNSNRAPWSLTLAPHVQVGAPVRAGELIAWSGNSGNAETSSPHTHFELRHRGRHVNPYPYLFAAHLRSTAAIEAEQLAAAFGAIIHGHHPQLSGDAYIV